MRPKLVLFGDSITEASFSDGGWGASLAHLFARKADVILRGYSGYNTRWAVKILDKAMAGIGGDAGSPAAVTVFFGANDASLPDQLCGFQHVPLEEYVENLRSIHAYFKKKWPSAVVIFIAPPPIDEEGRIKDLSKYDPSGQAERTNEAAGKYAKACIAVANELSTPVIDTWSKMQEIPDWRKSALSDGLHFTTLGNKVLFDEVVNTLKDLGLSDEKLPADLPYFYEVDPNDPSKTFGN
ncbi:SGNH hydrolase-type esterase superfamily protein [Carex rostrata]